MVTGAFIADFEGTATVEEAIQFKKSKHWKDAMDL